ncbi:hypothetical protein Tco_0019560 [Tanacetum coccineum]
MLPSSVLNGKSPFELVYKRKPNLSHLSPNDDGNDSSIEDGSLSHYDDHDSTQVPSPSQSSPTQINDDVQTPVLRRSDRQSKPPVRLNDYVLGSNMKREKMNEIGKERKKADGNKRGYIGKERKKAYGNKRGYL